MKTLTLSSLFGEEKVRLVATSLEFPSQLISTTQQGRTAMIDFEGLS